MVAGTYAEQIYNLYDNMGILSQVSLKGGFEHPLADEGLFYSSFPGGLVDPKVTVVPRPYRADSYILISAGEDGLYGTSDDIRNF